MVDAVVIGGGFYGASMAVWLAERCGLARVLLIEREAGLLQRASLTNQARVHSGYHYPRSFTTAFRSRVNVPRFVRDFPDALHRHCTHLYAIARRHSKVTARQFERFCREIGAPLVPAAGWQQTFDARLIEAVYQVEERVFDASRLASWAARGLHQAGVEVWCQAQVQQLRRAPAGMVLSGMRQTDPFEVTAPYVFNCTYSGLNQWLGGGPRTTMRLKHEIVEMALIAMPAPWQDLGVTVMDGPFFSMLPFPSRGLHTLSHVRFTPHLSWIDAPGMDPYARLAAYPKQTRFERMIRDVARYMPKMREVPAMDALFEVKTVLLNNENDDGRPILFERHADLPGCYSILGGKIDNIYDVFEQLEREPWVPRPALNKEVRP